MMIFVNLILLALLSFATPGWGQNSWTQLKQIVVQSDLEPNRKTQKELAKKAISEAEQCLKNNANEWGCLYYKAQAEGIANQSFFGYTDRVRQMIKDWEQVKIHDPTFDYGGPYRMVAEIYMELPKHFGPKDLRQDLKKSIAYLRKALTISDYPTNSLDLVEALLKSGNKEEAQSLFQKTKVILPQWSEDPYYPTWQARLKELF